MKHSFFFILVLFFGACGNDQNEPLSEAEQLLKRSIDFHDPNGNWEKLSASIDLKQETPSQPDRSTTILIDNTKKIFQHTQKYGDTTIVRTITDSLCTFELVGFENISSDDSAKYRLNCPMTERYRDYHIYLYGMPMKLKDPGTVIDKEIIETAFEGQDCQAIRVTYEKGVGEDIWYFYFENETAELIGYRFFHDEEKNDGEYITFKEMAIVEGIKMPKVRNWYFNSDSTFLGTDIITRD